MELEQTFIEAVEKSSTQDSLFVSSITNFDWDKLYFIETEYTRENIEDIIGFSYDCGTVPPYHNRYLFCDSDSEKGVHFDLNYDEGIYYCCHDGNYLTPETAIFIIQEEHNSEHIRYWLHPLFCQD